MEGTPDVGARRGGRLRTPAEGRTPSIGTMSTKERSIKAALEVLNGASTPSVAAATWGVGTGNVHYYKKSLEDQGMGVSPIPSPSPLVEADAVSLSSKAADWDGYSAAYVMAGELVFAGKSLRAAADEASAKYGVKLSYSSARRAAAHVGEPPAKGGKELIIPVDIEYKLEDLCLALREMQLPIFCYMILN
jgi:hypothetical protein